MNRDLLDCQQHVPERPGRVAIVGRKRPVLVERDWVGYLGGHLPDPYIDSRRLEQTHEVTIEIGDRASRQGKRLSGAVADLQHEFVL
jgi:hypothetical protein